MGLWGNRVLSAKSIQATRGPFSAFNRLTKSGHRTVATQSPENLQNDTENDILFDSFNNDMQHLIPAEKQTKGENEDTTMQFQEEQTTKVEHVNHERSNTQHENNDENKKNDDLLSEQSVNGITDDEVDYDNNHDQFVGKAETNTTHNTYHRSEKHNKKRKRRKRSKARTKLGTYDEEDDDEYDSRSNAADHIKLQMARNLDNSSEMPHISHTLPVFLIVPSPELPAIYSDALTLTGEATAESNVQIDCAIPSFESSFESNPGSFDDWEHTRFDSFHSSANSPQKQDMDIEQLPISQEIKESNSLGIDVKPSTEEKATETDQDKFSEDTEKGTDSGNQKDASNQTVESGFVQNVRSRHMSTNTSHTPNSTKAGDDDSALSSIQNNGKRITKSSKIYSNKKSRLSRSKSDESAARKRKSSITGTNKHLSPVIGSKNKQSQLAREAGFGRWSNRELTGSSSINDQVFEDGTSTPIFFKDLDVENRKNDPYRSGLPPNHPALNLPPVDVLFVVDNSGSIGNFNFIKVKKFVAQVVTDVYVAPGRLRVGVILFNLEPTTYFSLEKYYSNLSVNGSVLRMPYMGGATYLGKALAYSATYLQQDSQMRRKARKGALSTDRLQVMIIISDGYTEDGVEEQSRRLHENTRVRIAAVGVRGFNKDRLEILTRDPNNVFLLKEQELLSNWLFKNQFQWQETKEAGDRANTAALVEGKPDARP